MRVFLGLPVLLGAAPTAELRRIPAEEARQGVASDGRYVYAIRWMGGCRSDTVRNGPGKAVSDHKSTYGLVYGESRYLIFSCLFTK